MRIERQLAVVPLVVTLALVTACSGNLSSPNPVPSLPAEPIHVATLQDAQKLIGQLFNCELEPAVPDIRLIGNNLADFSATNAKDMTLIAITNDNQYVWASADGTRAVEAGVVNKEQPLGGGLMAGCAR